MSSARGSSSASSARHKKSQSLQPQPPPPLRRSLRSASRASSVQSDTEDQHAPTRKTRRGLKVLEDTIVEDESEGQLQPGTRRRPALSAPPAPRVSTPGRHSIGKLQAMPLDSRIAMLSSVAGDCLTKLLPVNSEDEDEDEDKDEDDDIEAQKGDRQRAFEGMRGVLQKYIYSSSTPPPLYTKSEELIELLNPSAMTDVARADLDRAIFLANFAAFVWTITYPDLAAELAGDEEIQEAKARRNAKPAPSSPQEAVRRRNAALIKAWTEYWSVLRRAEESAVSMAAGMWLEFAVEIVVRYQQVTIDPPSEPDSTLPSPPADLIAQLFSVDALEDVGKVQVDDVVKQLWVHNASRYRSQLESSTTRFKHTSYSDFRHTMRRIVRRQVLDGPDESVASIGGEAVIDNEPLSTEQPSESGISDDEPPEDDALDFDLFADIVEELDPTPEDLPGGEVANSGDDQGPPLPHDGDEEGQLLPFQGEDDEEDELLPSPSLLQGHGAAGSPEPEAQGNVVGNAGEDDQLDQLDSQEDSLMPQSLLNQQQSIDTGPDVDDHADPPDAGDQRSHSPDDILAEPNGGSAPPSPPPVESSVPPNSEVRSSGKGRVVKKAKGGAQAPREASSAAEPAPVTDSLRSPTPQPTPRPPVRQNQRAFLNRSYRRAEDHTAFAPDSEDELQELEDVQRPGPAEPSKHRVVGPRRSIQRRPATPEPATRSVSTIKIKQSPREPDLLVPYNTKKLTVSPLARSRHAPSSQRASSRRAPSAQQSSNRAHLASLDRAPSPDGLTSLRAASNAPAWPDAGASFIPPVEDDEPYDPLMVDWGGKALETNQTYVQPPDYEAPPSRLHGKVDGKAFRYVRKSGKRRWTDAEELTLYRTLQKVPMSESYPLRVVWYLHGEFGRDSRVLSDFNTQHMKDKMRTIIDRRRNQRLPIVGRARAFLPASDPRRKEFNAEMVHHNELEAELQFQAEAARKTEELSVEGDEEEEEDAQEDGVNDSELDELDSDPSDLAYLDELETDSEAEEPSGAVQPRWAVQSPPRRRRQLTVEIPTRSRLPGPRVPVPRASLPGGVKGKGKGKAVVPPPSSSDEAEEETNVDESVSVVDADTPQSPEASDEDEDEDEFFSMPSVSPPARERSLPPSTPQAEITVRLPRQVPRSVSRSVSPPVRRSARNQRGGAVVADKATTWRRPSGAVAADTGRVLRSADRTATARPQEPRRILRKSDASVHYREVDESDVEDVAPLRPVQEEAKRGRGRLGGSRARTDPLAQDSEVVEGDRVTARTRRAQGRASRAAPVAEEVVAPRDAEVENADAGEVEPVDADEMDAVDYLEAPAIADVDDNLDAPAIADGDDDSYAPAVADGDDSDSDSSLPLSVVRARTQTDEAAAAVAAASGDSDSDGDGDGDVPLAATRKRKVEALFLPGPDTDEDEELRREDEDVQRREVIRRRVLEGR